jgi:hypothetical protein
MNIEYLPAAIATKYIGKPKETSAEWEHIQREKSKDSGNEIPDHLLSLEELELREQKRINQH